jgi:DNA-binding transcriptional ArsR family regulator
VEGSEVVAALAALAQESRLAVFRLLVQRGPRGLPAGQIAERLGIPGPTLSFHLAQLGHAGLVSSRREGRSIIYAADYAGMQALMAYLSVNCCREDADGCTPPAPKRARARGRTNDGPEQRRGDGSAQRRGE